MKRMVQLLLSLSFLKADAHQTRWDILMKIESWPSTWEAEFKDAVFPGWVELDRSLLQQSGSEILAGSGFQMSLTFNNEHFDETDDLASGLPALFFMNGSLEAIDFLTRLDPVSYDEYAFLQFHPDGTLSYSPDGVGEYEGGYQITARVPEASTASFVLIFTLLISTQRKR